MKTYTLSFEACQTIDPTFDTYVWYAIENRIDCWLQMCRDYEDRELVDDNLIVFQDIAKNILIDKYFQPLPSSI